MKIAVQTGGPEERIGIDKTYEIVKAAGFDAVDVNLDHAFSGKLIRNKEKCDLFEKEGDEFLEYFTPWKEAALKYGIDNYQAHAPFPSCLADGAEYNDYLIECLNKIIRATAYINCHRLIVHPFYYPYDYRLTPEEEWNLNISSYAKLIDTAKECGVIICLENMFMNHRGKLYAGCCSDIEIACKYIDTLNEMAGAKVFGFCLDTGHALLCSLDPYDTMLMLGDRIEAFHVHDNNGISDQHLAPYMGVLDWNRFIMGLKAIGYDKTLSFETFNIWNVVDNELCPQLMAFIASAGKMFARKCKE